MTDYTKLYETACLNSDRKQQSELLNKHGNKIDFDSMPIINLSDACAVGNLTLVKSIIDNNKNNTNFSVYFCDDYSFRTACYNGHLEVAKWLLSNYPNIKVFDNFNDNLFQSVCSNGHLDVAKWLYSMNSTKVTDNFQSAFNSACCTGHLDIIKWILSIKKVDTTTGLRWATERGHTDIVNFLKNF